MIDFYTWNTPNGQKVHILLEETGLPYRAVPVNISRNEQFRPEFMAVNPNSKIPAIVDRDGTDGRGANRARALFESGAILIYLAEKAAALGGPQLIDPERRPEILQWLMFQMGGIGPMYGQALHFRNAAPEKIPYAIERYTGEVRRLAGVLDLALADRPYLAGVYSIADIAAFPWVRIQPHLDVALEEFPNLAAWAARIAERPAVTRALDAARALNTGKAQAGRIAAQAAQAEAIARQEAAAAAS